MINFATKVLCLIAVLICSSCSYYRVSKSPYDLVINHKTELQSDTVWSGKVLVRGVVFVTQNATLTIQPGTRIEFANVEEPAGADVSEHVIKGSGIYVQGKIIAIGSARERIVFTAARSLATARWGNIFLSYTNENRFEYVDIEHSRFGIHAHFSTALMRYCHLQYNVEGVRLGYSIFSIENSVIKQNHRGLNFRNSRHSITGNLITQNDVGIFLYRDNSRTEIHHNDFIANRDYAVRMGDFHRENMQLHDNWWGEFGDPERDSYDYTDDNSLGKVIAKPALRANIGEMRDAP